MYIYKFNFFNKNNECCYGFKLYHNKDFTEEQLVKMQEEALTQIVKNKDKFEKFAKEPNTLSIFEDIIVENICRFLIKEYDFKRTGYESVSNTDIDNLLEVFRGNKQVSELFEEGNEIIENFLI